MHTAIHTAVAGALLASAASVQAATVEVSSADDLSGLETGQSFGLNLALSDDFPSITGGVFDISFDGDVLAYQGLDFDDRYTFTNDQAGTAEPSGPATVEDVSFSLFLDSTGGGAAPIGELLFEATAEGTSDITFDQAQTGFTLAGGGGSVSDLAFENATAVVSETTGPVAPIPLPGTGLLLGAGLTAAGGYRFLAVSGRKSFSVG